MCEDNRLKILFVDDDAKSVETAKTYLTKQQEKPICEVMDFVKADSAIESERYDIIVLDLLLGSTSDAEVAGRKTYHETIWKKRFCPVIVYSARPELLDTKHPLIKSVKKGVDSQKKIWEAISEFKPYVDSIKKAFLDFQGFFEREARLALREILPYAYEHSPDHNINNKIVMRSARRRLAVLLEEQTEKDKFLCQWEQFIFPPIGNDPRMGDILHVKKESNNPENFLIVLSPSCDMTTENGGTPKIKNALVASCISVDDGLKKLNLHDTGKSKLGDKLRPIITRGYSEAVIPIPSFSNKIPTMFANTHDLIHIALSDIGENGKYEIVASIDSPFREMVSWAYMNNACRPGLPVRDFDSWVKEIIEKRSENKKV